MPRATLTVTIPETVWIGDLSRRYPGTTFRVLAAMPGEETGVGLLEVSGSSLEDVLTRMGDSADLIECSVLTTGPKSTLVQFETTDHTLLSPIRRSGAPFQLPVTIQDGEATLEVTAPRDRLSDLAAALDATNIRFTVDRIVPTVAGDRPLTDRQWSLVRTAVDNGYYDTPRECSLTDLADEVDLAKSTLSETLHRAEGRIVKRFVRNHAASLE